MDQQEFIANAFENGGMTPAKAAELLQMSEAEGETGTNEAPEIVAPNNEPGQEERTAELVDPKEQGTPAEAELNADNAVVMARDGKHTINFEVLADTRERLREKSAQLEAANQQLAELQALAQARADAGQAPTQIDNHAAAAQAAIDAGVDPALFGDFSPEAMANGVAKIVQAQMAAQMAAIDAKLQPIQQKGAQDATEAHLSAIYAAHADADSIIESQEFAAWKAGQPSFVRQALDHALTKGSTGQVIEVFDAFKKATAGTQAQTAAEPVQQPVMDPAAAAKAAIAKAVATPPVSLSDIPGGRPVGMTALERLHGLPAYAQVDAMSDMTDEQINSYLNSRI